MLVYWVTDPDDGMSSVEHKTIPLTPFYEGERKRYRLLVVDGLNGARPWGVHLSALRRWSFPLIVELSIPNEKIDKVEPVKFHNVPKEINLLYITVKDEWVKDGKFSPDQMKIVCPTTENELYDIIEWIIVHSADGCWFLTETVLPNDLKILRDLNYRKSIVDEIFRLALDKFRPLLTHTEG